MDDIAVLCGHIENLEMAIRFIENDGTMLPEDINWSDVVHSLRENIWNCEEELESLEYEG